MYYDPLLYKMIPGIFIVSNNKNYLLLYVKNDKKKLNIFPSLLIMK